jgi:hypothetical protein
LYAGMSMFKVGSVNFYINLFDFSPSPSRRTARGPFAPLFLRKTC